MGKQRNQCFKKGLFVILLFVLGACSSTSEMEDESANTESAASSSSSSSSPTALVVGAGSIINPFSNQSAPKIQEEKPVAEKRQQSKFSQEHFLRKKEDVFR